MKPIARQFRVFVAACAVTAAVWMMAWPEPAVVPEPPAKPVADVSGARWSKERIASLVAEVEAAKTDEARLHACGRLLQIPLADARETLETVNLKSGHGLSLVAKVLLIRWASGDGEAATDWAWKRFRSEGLWNDAFREIGPAWAAHKPASLAEWALRTMDNRKPGSDSITKREAEESERPLLEFGTFSKISGWLVTEDPRLAYQILIARGGMSSDDFDLPLSLTSVSKVREALLAFDHLDRLDPAITRNEDFYAKSLLSRWCDLDPEDFSRSPYTRFAFPNPIKETATALDEWRQSPDAATATRLVTSVSESSRSHRISGIAEVWAKSDPSAAANWLDSLPAEHAETTRTVRISILAPVDLPATLDWADTLPPESRSAALVAAFDAWSKAHPGERPDMTDWSENRRRAWTDLEALPASGVVSSGG